MLDSMTYEELLGWFVYFQKRPPDWRDDLRTTMLMRAQGVDKQGHELFHSLAQIRDASKKTAGVDMNLLRLLKGAKNGDSAVMTGWGE